MVSLLFETWTLYRVVIVKSNTGLDLNLMEGQIYIVGREGHIYIADKSVSRKHAEIKIIDGEIRLRDLESGNGTYVIKDNRIVQIKEAIVRPKHRVVIGKQAYTVQELLKKINVFPAHSDKSGLVSRL